MTTKFALLLDQFGKAILESIRHLKAGFEKRMSATDEAIKALRQEFIEKSSSQTIEKLSIKVEASELQEAISKAAQQIAVELKELHSSNMAQFEDRVKAFNEVACAREAAANEALGQVKLLAQDRSRPVEEIVRGVVDSLRADHSMDEARVKELIADATKQLQPLLDVASLAKSVAELLPSVQDVADAAALKVVPAPAPDLSEFVKADRLAEVVRGLVPAPAEPIEISAVAEQVVRMLPVAPAAEELAAAAARLVEVPDTSKFVTIDAVQDCVEKRLPICPSVEEIAQKAVALLPAAPSVEELAREVAKTIVAPDLSSFATIAAVHKLLDEHSAVVPVELDLEDIANKVSKLLPTLPSAKDIAAEAAGMVVFPAPPDVSQFVTAKQAQELIAEDRQRFATDPVDPNSIAKQVVTMLPEVPSLESVAKAAAALIPAPKDGRSFTTDEIQELIVKALAGVKMPTAQDVSELLETTHIAKWELDFERRAQAALQSVVDRIPEAKDGIDGMGFDDQFVEYDGERTFTFVLARGERRKSFSFKIPAMIYRGIFNENAAYERGDVATWAGSSWIALKAAPQGKPGQSGDWQLIVKKGRDGSLK
jgi:hypothetical protein